MRIEERLPLLDGILSEHAEALGADLEGYANHCRRMLNFCFRLRDCDAVDREKLVVAAAFHDLGIWLEDTLDYLPPSALAAGEYLRREKREDWIPEIESMIVEHHKTSEFRDPAFPLTETFRRADLIDFSLGLVRCGLPKSEIRAVRSRFPNAGFHRMLAGRAARRLLTHPLDPAPMMKR